MKRLYGTIELKNGSWHITAEPQVMIRLKRHLEKIEKTQFGTVTIKDSDEIRRELDWFMIRYPFKVSDRDQEALETGRDRHIDNILTLEKIMSPGYKPKAYKMAVQPRAYQAVVPEILFRKGFLLLADDLGLGKTISSITCLSNPKTLPAVVVTLTGILPLQWQREIKRCLPGLYAHIIETRKLYEIPKDPVTGRMPDVYILNYQKLEAWTETLAKSAKMIIYDEIQELRHDGTGKYAAAQHLSAGAQYRIGLSATPIFNYGGEIYNVMSVLHPDALGSRAEFYREWCTSAYGEKKISITHPKAFGAYLREQFLMLRRTRAEVKRELPPLSKIPHYVSTDPSAFDAIKDSASALAKIILSEQKISGFERMEATQELDWRLRQATGVGKAPYVADFVRMIVDDDEPVVVYAWHREVYAVLQAKLQDLNPVMFTGQETSSEKIAAIEAFKSGKTQVILISLRAGQGIDGLQHRCKTVVFAELDWSPGVHEQAIGRVFRDGQPDPVSAFFLMANEGSDPVVAEALGVKREQVEGIRNPTHDIVEALQVDQDRIKKLARHYLSRAKPENSMIEEQD